MVKKEKLEPGYEELRQVGESRYSPSDYGIDDKEAAKIDGYPILIDYLQDRARTGFPEFLGFAFYISPLNTDIVLDFTTQMGGCSNMYWSYVFQMPKWAYNIRKVSEAVEVSPTHADAYNLFIGQRQRIETQIKQGLGSALDSVKDYEMLSHDVRRYKEILDYFKEGRQDEHILRSLFVDRVDAFTGEGYSMVTMAKRWPTIITDFIRMGQKEYVGKEWSVDDIRQTLDVTQAEATVLKTKDRLFREWKRLFLPTVAERHARMKAMADARKKSIEEYKQWLKPYIARHKMMREMAEKPSAFVTKAVMAPAFGTGFGASSVRLWVWKAFPIGEKRKPEARMTSFGGTQWIVDPYDDFSKEWIKKIEYKHALKPGYYSEKMVRDLMKGWASRKTIEQAENPVFELVPSEYYYVLFDLNVQKSIIKTPPPSGGETVNMMLNPLRTWVVSQNVMLLHLIELDAIEREFDNQVDEMLGVSSIEKDYLDETKMDLGVKKRPKEGKNAAVRFMERVGRGYSSLRKGVKPLARYFFRPGPYESAFHERVVKMYLVEVGAFYKQQVEFWKSKAGVG